MTCSRSGLFCEAPLREALALLLLSPLLLGALIWLLIIAVILGAKEIMSWLIYTPPKRRINTCSPKLKEAMPSAQNLQKPRGS